MIDSTPPAWLIEELAKERMHKEELDRARLYIQIEDWSPYPEQDRRDTEDTIIINIDD